MKFHFSLALLLLPLCACSLYQSEGRKFLEKQAFEYAGVSAQANLLSCQSSAANDRFRLIRTETRALVYAHPEKPLQIRVVPLVDRRYDCDYGFTTDEELDAKVSSAIELTLQHLSSEAP
jgi:hypothetical protein